MMFLKFFDDLERIEEDAAIFSCSNHDPLIPFPYVGETGQKKGWDDW